MQEWSAFKRRNPRAKMVCVDVQPYKTVQAHGTADVLNVGGFSDEVFRVVADFCFVNNCSAALIFTFGPLRSRGPGSNGFSKVCLSKRTGCRMLDLPELVRFGLRMFAILAVQMLSGGHPGVIGMHVEDDEAGQYEEKIDAGVAELEPAPGRMSEVHFEHRAARVIQDDQ